MEWRGSKAWESSGQIFLCFKFAKQKFFLTRNLVCFNFLEMLIFTLSSFVYFCLVCFFEGEGWFRGWIEGNYMLAHLLCINFFHRTMLPWVCTITDHQTHLNVIRTSGHTWLHAPHASHVFIKVVEFSNSVMVPQQYEIEISKQWPL